jgi:WD40 repeat protein
MTIQMIPQYYDIGQSCGQQQDENDEHGTTTGYVTLCNPKTIQESHEKEIYCIAWSKDVHHQETTRRSSLHDDDDYDDDADIDGDDSRILQPRLLHRYMATCAGRHVCVYQVPIASAGNTALSTAAASCSSSSAKSSIMDDVDDDDRAPELEMIQSYMDSDAKEEFYACVFAGRSNEFDARTRATTTSQHQYLSGEAGTGPQLLCVAGMGRGIKVIDPVRQELVATLQGHGNHVYDLKLSPTNDFLLLSASKDQSIRLWNLKTGSMVAIFAGHHAAHCDDIVSISWHVSGHRFVSSGMDRKILIWNVGPGTEVYNAVQSSHQVAQRLLEHGQRDHEKPVQCFFPIFSTCTFPIYKRHYFYTLKKTAPI